MALQTHRPSPLVKLNRQTKQTIIRRKKMGKFTLEIDMGNSGMLTGSDVAQALAAVVETLNGFEAQGITVSQTIKDENGNRVGAWRMGETRTYAPRKAKNGASAAAAV